MKTRKNKNKPYLQILFLINLLVTEIGIIKVPFSGTLFANFLHCTRYFRAITPRDQKNSRFPRYIMASVAEGK